MIYIYRQRASSGARELAEALGGRRVRDLSRIDPYAGDLIVCWGESAVGDYPCRYLNNGPIRSKFADALTLKAAGVSTIEVVKSIPPFQPFEDLITARWEAIRETAQDFLDLAPHRSAVVSNGLREIARGFLSLAETIDHPVVEGTRPQWLPRTNSHTGGNDLLKPPLSGQIDYYSRRESLSHEYRVHSFNGQSIRAGKKVPRPGVDTPHDWIRSWDGGWRISYDGVSIRNTHRELAHQAISALGLTFGAVDIGERQDGSLLVLEVNRAPGLEGGTVTAYAAAIQRLMEGVRE
jgi:hypothetical protein